MTDENTETGETSESTTEALKSSVRSGCQRVKPRVKSAGNRVRQTIQGANRELGRRQKLTVASGLALITLTVLLAASGFVPSAGTVVFAGVMLLAFAIGLLGIPALIFLSGDAGIGILGRILWTIATLAQGGLILRHEDSGEYQTYAPLRDSEDRLYIKTDDGRQYIDTPSGHWFRLGKKRFGICYEKSEKMYGDLLADLDDEYISERATSDKVALADGGIHKLDMVRGGYQAFTRHANSDNPSEDGWILRVDKAVSRKRGAGGRKQAGKAKEQTLKEFGGNQGQIAGKWFYIACLGALMIGAFSSYLGMAM